MKLELNENMLLAIKIGIQELNNVSVWESFVSEEEREQVHNGIDELEKILNKN